MTSEANSLESLVLPPGWFCVSMSATGVGLYEKWVKGDSKRFSGSSYMVAKYRVVYTPFSYGWTIQKKSTNGGDWTWYMQPLVFPSHMGAIVAFELESSNNSV